MEDFHSICLGKELKGNRYIFKGHTFKAGDEKYAGVSILLNSSVYPSELLNLYDSLCPCHSENGDGHSVLPLSVRP